MTTSNKATEHDSIQKSTKKTPGLQYSQLRVLVKATYGQRIESALSRGTGIWEPSVSETARLDVANGNAFLVVVSDCGFSRTR